MRDPKLLEGNSLILVNKSGKDVTMESCFHDLLGEIFFSILDPDKLEGHAYGRVNMEFLKQHVQDFSQEFYVCGPEPTVEGVIEVLIQLEVKPKGITFGE